MKKPRTYRKIARKAYLSFCKKKRPCERDVLKAKREQLGFFRRNFRSVQELSNVTPLDRLSKRERKNLMIAADIYRRQLSMYRERKHSIDNRIVSMSQPHVRPIVRGKTSVDVEFGAKVSVSRYMST